MFYSRVTVGAGPGKKKTLAPPKTPGSGNPDLYKFLYKFSFEEITKYFCQQKTNFTEKKNEDTHPSAASYFQTE